jgi:hypothetical protein
VQATHKIQGQIGHQPLYKVSIISAEIEKFHVGVSANFQQQAF